LNSKPAAVLSWFKYFTQFFCIYF